MSARDYIAEIIEIRERRSSNSAHTELFLRLLSLEHAFKKAPIDNEEVLKYFPIALVATMEGCFRVMISELIDHGEPFFSNCDQLLKNHKITFNIIKAFQGKQISVGEFVSRVVSVNKLDDINSFMSTIVGKDFLTELKGHKSRWDIEVHKKEDVPILTNPDETYKNIVHTFELRHIFCHETAAQIKINYQEIEQCFQSASVFLKASTDYVSELMYPNAPLTQTDMNINSAQELENIINKILEKKAMLVQKLSSENEKNRITLLETSYNKWFEYMKYFSTYVADEYEGGSIWPLIYNSTGTGIAKDYLKVLKNELKKG